MLTFFLNLKYIFFIIDQLSFEIMNNIVIGYPIKTITYKCKMLLWGHLTLGLLSIIQSNCIYKQLVQFYKIFMFYSQYVLLNKIMVVKIQKNKLIFTQKSMFEFVDDC